MADTDETQGAPPSDQAPDTPPSPTPEGPSDDAPPDETPSDGGAPAEAQGPVVEGVSLPAWGPPVVVGSIGTAPVEVPEPLNEAAVQAMTPLAGVALVLHQRCLDLEKRMELLERDLALHQRIARLEAQLGSGPGASSD